MYSIPINNHTNFCHQLVIDYQYQSINWYQLVLIDINCHWWSIYQLDTAEFIVIASFWQIYCEKIHWLMYLWTGWLIDIIEWYLVDTDVEYELMYQPIPLQANIYGCHQQTGLTPYITMLLRPFTVNSATLKSSRILFDYPFRLTLHWLVNSNSTYA